MHFSTYVVVPPGYHGDIEDYVERAMAPFNENANLTTWEVDEEIEGGGYWTNANSFWDWYQIGGRWSGAFAEGYEPEKDQRNWERCDLCNGTGVRTDSVKLAARPDGKGWCNACTHDHENNGLPVGWRVKWPTDWVSDVGNIARLGDIRSYVEEHPPYYLLAEGVTAAEVKNPDWDGGWGEGHPPYHLDNGEAVAKALTELSDDCTIVVVDCHC